MYLRTFLPHTMCIHESLFDWLNLVDKPGRMKLVRKGQGLALVFDLGLSLV